MATSTSIQEQLSDASDPRTLTGQTTYGTVLINSTPYTVSQVFSAGPPATVTYTTPAGRTATLTLDANDRVTQVQVGGDVPGHPGSSLNATNIGYDSGRLGTISQGSTPTTLTTTYHYNSSTGFLDSVDGPFGSHVFNNPTQDALGRPSHVSLPGGNVVGLTYDTAGHVNSVTVPQGYVHGYGFNADDLLGSHAPPSASPGGPTNYGYSPERLLSYVEPPGTVVSYDHDADGRISSISYPSPVDGTMRQTSFGYYADNDPQTGHAKGHVSTIDDTDVNLTYKYNGPLLTSEEFQVPNYGATFDHTVHYGYGDHLPRVTSRDIDGAAGFTFTYDDLNGAANNGGVGDADGYLWRITGGGQDYTVTRAANGMIASPTVGALSEGYEYDLNGALTRYWMKHGQTTLYEADYTRNHAGSERVQSETEIVNGISCAIGYDYYPDNRLHTVTNSCGGGGSYSYNPDGTMSGPTHDAQDRTIDDGPTHFAYAADGSTYSQSGSNYLVNYRYDPAGNLLHFDRNDGGNARTYDYRVDGLNRRIARTTQDQRGWLYDGDRIIGEVDGTGRVVAHFAYFTHANVPDLMLRLDWDNNWILYRIVTDQLGTVKAVIRTSDGAVMELYSYSDAWGAMSAVYDGNLQWLNGGSPTFQPFGFAGGLVDYYAGTLRYGARDYNPWQRRWLTQDPIGQAGGLYVYGYCHDDPVNCADPSGRFGVGGLLDLYNATVGSFLGKINAAEATAVGLAFGAAGVATNVVDGKEYGVDYSVDIGNNAIEFKGHPVVGAFTPAVTLGNVICYENASPGPYTQAHERQHTYQAETLGDLYLPAQADSQVLGFVSSFFDSSHTYSGLNDRVHGPGNLLETGPSMVDPQPWPW